MKTQIEARLEEIVRGAGGEVGMVDASRTDWGPDPGIPVCISVRLEGATDVAAALEQCTQVPGVRSLFLANAAMTDAHMEFIGRCQWLRSVDVAGTAITDQGLSALSVLERLRTLVVCGTAVTDNGLLALRPLQCLDTLCLDRTRITDIGLVALCGLQRLRTLSVSVTGVGDAGLARWVRSRPGIAALDVDHTKAGRAAAEAVGQCTTLELRASHTCMDDEAVRLISGPSSYMESLALDGTAVTDACGRWLKDLEWLKRLSLRNTAVTDAILEFLPKVASLWFVDLRDTKVTDQGIARLMRDWHGQELHGPSTPNGPRSA
jgi:internalin A